jgi:hypothetical protein
MDEDGKPASIDKTLAHFRQVGEEAGVGTAGDPFDGQAARDPRKEE